jgi:hypothetical protein
MGTDGHRAWNWVPFTEIEAKRIIVTETGGRFDLRIAVVFFSLKSRFREVLRVSPTNTFLHR